MKLKITLHAMEKMAERGIDKDMIWRAIKCGAVSRQTDGLLARHTYIEVAYKVCGEWYIIKTVKIV